MKSEEMTSLIDLFNKQNIQYFAGPTQRNIEWVKKDFEKYYNDLMNDTDVKSKHVHYMNTVVIKPFEENRLLKYISLTNGQQRMTITYLHICAICAYVKNNDISDDEFNYENIKNTLLVNPTQSGEDYYKLLLRKKDRDTLKRIVDELPEPLNNKAGSSKIITIYNFLYNQLNKFNYQETFDKLFNMVVTPVIVEPEDDENTIFNDINSTGKKLSLFDQVRSYCLGKYTLKEAERLEEKYWEEIYENIRGTENFIISFMTFTLGERSRQTYDTFVEFVNEVHDVESVQSKIYDFYKLYKIIETANTPDEEINYLLKGLNLIHPQSQLVGIVKLYSLFLNQEITSALLKDCLKLLLSVTLRWKLKVNDSFGFRTFLTEKIDWITPFNLYSKLYKKLSPLFVSDNQFTMILQTKNFYRGKKEEFEEENSRVPSNINKITDYLLISIENHHYPKGRINPKQYTKEHICPQTLDNGWEHFFTKEDHHDYVHSLGNLTLTAYNSEYSNLPFEDKKTMKNGFEDDKLYLNKCICSYTSWTVDSIKQRTELMAGELCEIFNIPKNTLIDESSTNQSILVGGK
ncbi:DUF262 domain-containing protein [Methanobrevibacter sp.]|uniref:DUF262 domain-containing protein n=1 Tax=Methanobrevibacter sp. TaxID=66852 RepID=UPI0038640FD4